MGVSVRQKKPGGPWWIFVSHHGKRTSKQVGDKKDANKLAKEVRTALAAGDLGLLEEPEAPGATFADFADEFLERVRHDLKHSTLVDYESVVRVRLKPILGELPLDELNRRAVANLEAQLRAEGLSDTNLRKHLRVLSSILSAAVEDELIESNPVLGRGRGRHRSKQKAARAKRRIDPFDAPEVSLLLQTMQTHTHRKRSKVVPQFRSHFPFVLTIARAGLRLGEAIALQWGDIDWRDGTIFIQRSVTKGVVDVPKGGMSRRVDMTDELRRVLRDVYSERFGRVVAIDANAEAVRHGDTLDALVFPDCSGGMIDDSNFRRRIWKPLLAAAGLRHRRIHDLRHSYASLLLQDGAELMYVSQQLGHHSAAFTLETYGHLMPRDRRGVANRLDELSPVTTPRRADGETTQWGQPRFPQRSSEVEPDPAERPLCVAAPLPVGARAHL